MAGHTSAARLSRCISPRYFGAGSSVRCFQSSAATLAHQTQPLYPSVAQLLHENNIPESEIPKIPATGPQGRLLKGDILSYIGAIPSDYPSTLSSRLSKLAHLDLSNVKPAAPPAKPRPEQQKVAEAAPEPTPVEDLETTLALPISLSRVLSVQQRVRSATGVTIPLEKFVVRAIDVANDELPATQGYTRKEVADQLFDELVGVHTYKPLPTSKGAYIPDIISAAELDSIPKQSSTEATDIIDILSGKASVETNSRRPRTTSPAESEDEAPMFSITVPESERLRGQAFLDRMQAILEDEPERLMTV
ncbi:predicted protein [Uncinocarpus reesii 1704]|uniref:Peripheral subunit-binding (PSBD) domain-containing protein n=1 Tax=Uncinocarpus reesii (strain UAMH 1704) TaxID=336963 RepID=C4JZS7_UNCRE|nr:uncharacterized protein UREG_07678 [Uncinocarpus reesii 1704]EEP82813.1 predicted protein [Uncinocarpus reesii 1704]